MVCQIQVLPYLCEWESIRIFQVIDDSVLDQHSGSKSNKNSWDSKYILKINLVGFTDGLAVGFTRKRKKRWLQGFGYEQLKGCSCN